ncbi:MAG: lysylphosphatidylglycerol synthase transmembrane domain-containing protein [Methanomicrobiales archaeon]
MNFKMQFKGQRKLYLKIIISVLFLVYLLTYINLNVLVNSIYNVNQTLFLLALILIPLSIFIRALRWYVIINKDIKIISIKNSFNLTLVGMALNIFLPASSGDIAKSYYGYKWYGYKEEMISSSIVDKLIALLSVFIIGTISSLFFDFYYLHLFSFLVVIGLLLILFYPQFIPWKILNLILRKFKSSELIEHKLISSFSISNKKKFITLSISILAWLVSYLQFFVICKSFNLDISILYIFAISPIVTLAALFPFTFNGMGSVEAVNAYLFSLINISPTLAIFVTFFNSQILATLIPGIFGLIIILKK